MKLKANIYVPDKDFSGKGNREDITVTVKEPNSDGEVIFEADIPTHVFEKLKDTADVYKTKENGGSFRKKVSLSHYKFLCESIQSYCYDSEKIQNMEKLEKQKKLFIRFDFLNRLTRDNWCGAGTGNALKTHFQYFVGYKTSTMRVKIGSSFSSGEVEESECVKYLSKHVMLVEGRSHKENSLQPLNMDWRHHEIENTYKIIDWTQEREDFLSEIENKFNDLGTKLNEFLGDLDNEKIDSLIENKLKLLE